MGHRYFEASALADDIRNGKTTSCEATRHYATQVAAKNQTLAAIVAAAEDAHITAE